jgi:hypothetical protein
MGLAYPKQKFQDWFTQQWAILWGKKIAPEDFPWLIGPFGNVDGIGSNFINQLAEGDGLITDRDTKPRGLIPSIKMLHLSNAELSNLSQKVIDFYENTSQYDLKLTVQWNPFFKVFGILVNKLFSNRINQLNIPLKNVENTESIKSEIITLIDPTSHQVKYTIWLRTSLLNNQVIYSGIYGACTLPNGKTCVKAVFPLPNGNATVILHPAVGPNGELILESWGKKFGDAGFYFLLHDSRGNYWSQFIGSFRDRLIVREENDVVSAEQTLTLWHQRVVKFTYSIKHARK